MATNPNRRRVESGIEIIAVSIPGQNRADVFVAQPGHGSHPIPVDMTPFLDAGMDEGATLERIVEIVAIGVRGARA